MSKKILVIDDEPKIVELVKARLEANHYEVFTASDGVEGLAVAQDKKPDLIVLDILMPNLDGHSFVKEMRTIEDIKATPIIVLTAKDQMQDLFRMEGITSDCYIVKPFKAKEFLNKVREILGEE